MQDLPGKDGHCLTQLTVPYGVQVQPVCLAYKGDLYHVQDGARILLPDLAVARGQLRDLDAAPSNMSMDSSLSLPSAHGDTSKARGTPSPGPQALVWMICSNAATRLAMSKMVFNISSVLHPPIVLFYAQGRTMPLI